VVAGRGDRHAPHRAEERAIAALADDNDLVLTWPDGRPLHPDLITDWFQRHARRVVWEGRTQAGRPAGDPAARRAAQLRDRGTGRRHPRQGRQRAARHANVQLTPDTSSHVIPGLDEHAAATVTRLILEGSDAGPTRVPGGDAADSVAQTGGAPHSRRR
jgi:hypothetical protein